ncbi:hypothetical protein Trydic_g9280 [Trypoxylus dichotomus]
MKLTLALLVVLIASVWYAAEADEKAENPSKRQKSPEKADNSDDDYYHDYSDIEGSDSEVVYIVSTSKGNVSGLAMISDTVTSGPNEGDNPKLCQMMECFKTTLLKKTPHFNFWKPVGRPRSSKKSLPFRWDEIKEIECFANYEGTKKVVAAENIYTRIKCEPPCQKNDALVCEDVPLGIVLGDPLRLFGEEEITEEYMARDTAQVSRQEPQPDQPAKNEENSKLRTSADSGADDPTALKALPAIFAIVSIILLSYIR